MATLDTSYMGIALKNPLVVAACSLSKKVDNIKKAEDAGAGALVIRSLFEEQIMREIQDLDDALDQGGESFAEAVSYFPRVEHGEAKEHVMWVEAARKETKLPLIASINAVSSGKWVEYAAQLAKTGIDGIELNVYAVEADLTKAADAVEGRMLETVAEVVQATELPVAVKLSPYYTSAGNVISRVEQTGAKAVIMFNRFLQPDIDVDTESTRSRMTASTAEEMRVPLRWIGLLYGKVGIDMIGNTGAKDAEDLVRYILAGANAVQIATTLYRNGIDHIGNMLSGLGAWMDAKGYASLADFRGKCSQAAQKGGEAYAFERAQYMDFLLGQRDS